MDEVIKALEDFEIANIVLDALVFAKEDGQINERQMKTALRWVRECIDAEAEQARAAIQDKQS